MKKIVAFLLFSMSMLFGFNFNGEWVNSSSSYDNDPVKLLIKEGSLVRPYIKRGSKVAKLKAKYATKVGSYLYEAWGFNNKNLVLLLQPINKTKIRVIEKKIDVSKRKIITKSFIFINKKRASIIPFKKRFLGSYHNPSSFSAVNKLKFFMKNNQLLIKARKRKRGILGTSVAWVKNSKLYTKWQNNNIIVNATITGLDYDSKIKKYKRIKLYIKAKNIYTGLVNTQTIYLNRINEAHSRVRHIEVGPFDINLMLKSY